MNIKRYLILIVFLIYSFCNLISQNVEIVGQEWVDKDRHIKKLINARKYVEALNLAKENLEDAKDDYSNLPKFEVAALSVIGEIYFRMGDYTSAMKYFQKELGIKKKIYGENNPKLATAVHNLATMYRGIGQLATAEKLFLEALDIKRHSPSGKDTSYAKTLHNLAGISKDLGKYKESETYLTEVLAIKKSQLGESHHSYGRSLIAMGYVYQKLGNHSETAKNLEKGIAILSNSIGEENSDVVNAQLQLARSYMRLGQDEKAKPLMDKAQKLQEKILGNAHPDFAQTLYSLGNLKWSMKKYDQAEKHFQQAKTIIQKRLSNAHPLFSSCLNALGVLSWTQGNLQKALEYLSQAAYLREQIYGSNNPSLPTTIHNLAGLLKELGKFKQAEKNYKKAFDLYLQQIDNYFPFLSTSEKAKFNSKIQEKFNLFNCYVIERHKENPTLIGSMYNYHISTKAILLNSARKVKNAIFNSGDKDLIEKYNSWLVLNETLSQLYTMNVFETKGKNIDSLEKVSNNLEKEISTKSFAFLNEYEKKKVTWKDIQAKLKPDEAAVEIIRFKFFNNASWSDTVFYVALIITKETVNNPDMIIISNGKELEELYIRSFNNSIKYQIPDIDAYKQFWAKIDEKTKDKKKIYLSQDGIYNKLNINTIQRPDGSYIIDHQTIVFLSNTKDLVSDKQRKYSNSLAYLIGFPDYNMQIGDSSVTANIPKDKIVHIDELWGTRKEVSEIDTLLQSNNWKTKRFMRSEASEKAIKSMSKARILHVATHGFFDNNMDESSEQTVFGVDIEKAIENPLLRSGLMFAGAAQFLQTHKSSSDEFENGILTAFEAMNLQLEETELVVLSACETGLGEVVNGEGVYGLQRALLVAGAEHLIMSLWKVNDKTTQMLMTRFYKNWLSDPEKDIHKAFRNAQLEIKENLIFSHPYYWGAFLVIGE